MNELKLGDNVRSKVSSFTGTLTATCEYLHGEPQGRVTLTTPFEGKVRYEWFPLSELEAVK
jgi:hypothetical protein